MILRHITGTQVLIHINQSARHSRKGVRTMNLQDASDLVRHTLIMALIISSPMLVIGLVVGLVVSLVQAVTQIQEQTLSFVPKTVAMVTAAIVLLPWISQRLIEYASAMFSGGALP